MVNDKLLSSSEQIISVFIVNSEQKNQKSQYKFGNSWKLNAQVI